MNRSAIEQLRDVNPHPRTLPAPPIETVLGRLGERPGPDAGGPRSRRRPRGALVFPLLTSAVAIGVLVLVLTNVHSGHAGHSADLRGPGAAGHPIHVTSSGSPVAPRRGMRGSVYSFNATALAPTGNGIVSLQQCLGCKSDGTQTPRSHVFEWLLSTSSAGAGSLVRTPYLLAHPQLSGQNGWASGIQSDGHGAGGTAEFYVSHDAGRRWAVAPSAAPNYGDQQLSLGFGEVWSVGQPGSATVVLHAPASGSRLLATAAQPTHGMWPNAQVAAAGPGMAYLANGNAPGQIYVTRDDGRSWEAVARPCPAGAPGLLTNVAFGNAVWVVCPRARHTSAAHMTLSRSTDGGRRWTTLPTPFSAGFTVIVSPVSASVLWAQSGNGGCCAARTGERLRRSLQTRPGRAYRTLATGDAAGCPGPPNQPPRGAWTFPWPHCHGRAPGPARPRRRSRHLVHGRPGRRRRPRWLRRARRATEGLVAGRRLSRGTPRPGAAWASRRLNVPRPPLSARPQRGRGDAAGRARLCPAGSARRGRRDCPLASRATPRAALAHAKLTPRSAPSAWPRPRDDYRRITVRLQRIARPGAPRPGPHKRSRTSSGPVVRTY